MGAPLRPPWDFRRTSHGVRITLATAHAHGIAAADIVRGTGLTEADIARPETQVEAGQELAVTRNLLTRLGDQPGLGMETGLRYTLASMGILGFALLSSRTLREAVDTGLRYHALASAFVQPRLLEEGEYAHIEFDDTTIPADVRGFLVERDIAALVAMTPAVFGGTLPDVGFSLRTALSSERRDVLKRFLEGTEVLEAAAGHRLSYPRRLLDEPLPAADPDTAQLCARQCKMLLDRRAYRPGTAATVRSRLLREPGTIPSMAQVAAELHITPRTLHRRLAAESVTFRTLLDEVRDAIATELLSVTSLSVQQIATRLGYTETASFLHAFQRWHHTSPGQYRQSRDTAKRLQ